MADRSRKCSQCGREIGYHLSCPHCRELNVPDQSDGHFELFGLEPRFDIDTRELEARFLALSRELHPDYFQDRPELRSRSVFLAATLNDAFDTLNDPFKRSEYLLRRAGGPSSSDDKRLPPGFLLEMMELREALDEARAQDAAERLESVRRDLESRRSVTVGRLATLLRGLGETPPRAPDIGAVREELNVANYLNSMRRDLLGKA